MGRGGMSFGMKTVRLVMVLFNVVFFFIGAALLASAIYLLADPKYQKLKEFFPLSKNPGVEKGLSYLEMIPITSMVLGLILLIMGFLGCCGAMKQVKLFLTCYALIVGVMVMFEVAMTIYFIAFQRNFQYTFVPRLQDYLQDAYEGPLGLIFDDRPKPSAGSLAWDFAMYNFECCGVEGKEDFARTKKWNRTNPWSISTVNEFKFPLTCCPMGRIHDNWMKFTVGELQQAADCARFGVGIYEVGCYKKLVEFLNSTKSRVILVAVIIVVIELLVFILTLALCCRRKKDTLYYSS